MILNTEPKQELKMEQKWMKFKEKNPTPGQTVLVYAIYRNPLYSGTYGIARYNHEGELEGTLFDNGELSEGTKMAVAWMPIPDPPKIDDEVYKKLL